MKTKSFLFFVMFSCALVSAQKQNGFGLRAGVSYNQNGDLFASIGDAGEDILSGADANVGYHIGVFGKLNLLKIYVRPELIYSRTSSTYDISGEEREYDISKLDLPVLVGINIIGPLHVFAGPAFQYTLDNEFEGLEIEDVENEFSVGLNAGVGVNIGKIGIDLRYERGFNENEAEFITDNVSNISGRLDSRPEQLIFSLSLKL